MEGVHSEMRTGHAEMTTKQKEDMNKALLNLLILDQIVAGMDLPDLKNCRMVSRSWKNVSNKVILKEQTPIIRFSYRMYRDIIGGQNFRMTKYRDVQQFYDLAKFNKILDNAKNFPCSHYCFENLNEFGWDFMEFLRIQGDSIKTLKLGGDLRNGSPSTNKLCNILASLPNLETLKIYDFGNHESMYTSSKDPEIQDFLLPSLKEFAWTFSLPAGLKILNSSPNLERITGQMLLTEHMLEALKQSGKASLVQECHRQHWTSTAALAKFLTFGVQLRVLRISMYPEDEEEHVVGSKLLEACKNSLESLELFTIESNMRMIVLPKLTKLKILDLGFSNQRIFPPRINLSETFPHLQVLECSFCYLDDEWDTLFPPDAFQGQLSTVHTVKIRPIITELGLSRLAYLCPNIKTVFLISVQKLPFGLICLTNIFKCWTHLEWLEISAMSNDLDNYPLEPVITGFSEERCQFLRVHEEEEASTEEIAAATVSIRNMKELKVIKLDLSGRLKKLPFSRVSGIYGFGLMPDMKVIIQTNGNDLAKWMYGELGAFANIKTAKGP